MKESKKIYNSLSWKLIERFSTQGVQLIIQIVLARLLLPNDFGILAILLVFLNFSNIFIQSGLNIALVQKKDSDELDFSSVFWTSCIISSILYIVLYFSAPTVGYFYEIPKIVNSIRVIGISLFIGPLNTIYSALIMKKMLFKKQFLSTMVGNIGYGVIGITMALFDFGLWALVIAHLSSIILSTITLMVIIKWKISLTYSISRMKHMFSFSWKMLLSSILFVSSDSLYGLFIGKRYSSESLGFYNRANKFPLIASTSFNSAISAVIFPVLTSKQDNTFAIKKILYDATRKSTFIIAPLMLGMSALSEPIIRILLTDKWILAIPIMQIICIEYSISSIHTTSIQAYAATGKSFLVLRIEIVRLVLFGLSLLVGSFLGFYYIFYFRLISVVLIAVYIIFINIRTFEYKLRQQIKSVLPNFLLSIPMYIVAIILTDILKINIINTLLIVAISVSIYVVLAIISKNEDYKFFYNQITKSIKSIFAK